MSASAPTPVRAGQYAELGNGMRLHYSSAGEPGKPLLLFVHGFPEAGFAWDEQLAAFGADYYAVAPDLRGFNLSSQPPEVEKYRAKYLVDDLTRFITHLGHTRALIVAHDWGGAICWNLAIMQPQWVEKLIIINSPHPYLFMRDLVHNPTQQASSAYMNWLRATGAEQALAKDDFALMDRLLVGHMHGQTLPAPLWYTDAVRARYHAMWARGLTGGLNYYRASPLHPPKDGEPGPAQLDMKPEDWRVPVPVRVIWGESDVALPINLLDGLDEVCPDLRITRIPEGTHWIVHEQPERVSGLIRGYLDN